MDVDPESPERFETRTISHKWRNLIKFNYTTVVGSSLSWKDCKNQAIRRFVTLFNSFNMIHQHFILLHRSYISILDLTENKGAKTVWLKHKKLWRENKQPGGYKSLSIVRAIFPEPLQDDGVTDLRTQKKKMRFHARDADSVVNHWAINVLRGTSEILSFAFVAG